MYDEILKAAFRTYIHMDGSWHSAASQLQRQDLTRCHYIFPATQPLSARLLF